MKSGLLYKSLLSLCILLFGASRGFSFTVPERLEYQIVWNGVHAGTSTLSIDAEGDSVLRIVSTARSAKFISLFYEVDDKVESLVRKGSFIPLNYRMKIKEGATRKDKEIQFPSGERKTAVFIDHRQNERQEFDLPADALDALSSFYFVRTLPLEVGKSVFVTVFDNKKILNVEVKVLKKEKVETWMGRFNTILIKPVMKSEGIFSRKGDIYIWLTDDEKKVPVMLKSEVKIGSIRAILKKGSF